jgi:hypothetical protein
MRRTNCLGRNSEEVVSCVLGLLPLATRAERESSSMAMIDNMQM